MTATVTTRIPEELLRQVDAFSEEKHMDRATLLRNLIAQGILEETRRKVLAQYAQRKISLQKAASQLKLDIPEMLSLVQKEGLYLDYTEKELKEDLKGL